MGKERIPRAELPGADINTINFVLSAIKGGVEVGDIMTQLADLGKNEEEISALFTAAKSEAARRQAEGDENMSVNIPTKAQVHQLQQSQHRGDNQEKASSVGSGTPADATPQDEEQVRTARLEREQQVLQKAQEALQMHQDGKSLRKFWHELEAAFTPEEVNRIKLTAGEVVKKPRKAVAKSSPKAEPAQVQAQKEAPIPPDAASTAAPDGTGATETKGEIDRTRLRKAAQQIVREWEQGTPNDRIEADLKASGWKAADISEVFIVADMTQRRWTYDEAASLRPEYEAPTMDHIKRAYDPLQRFFKKLSKDKQNNFKAFRARLIYGVSRESENEKRDGSAGVKKEDIVWQRADNYHDFLRMCQGPLRGLHTRISVSGRDFLDRLADPKDPLHAYEEEWSALRNTIRRPQKGNFPRDEYAMAVLRGEVEIPEITDEEAWAPLVPSAFAGDETIAEEWVPEVPELVSEEDMASAEVLDSELLNAAEPDDGFELPVATHVEPKIDPVAARIEAEEQDTIDRNIAATHPRSAIEMELKSFDEAFDQLYPPEPGWLTTSAPDDVFDAFHKLKHEYRNAQGEERDAVADQLHAFLNDPEGMSERVHTESMVHQNFLNSSYLEGDEDSADAEPATFEDPAEEAPLEEGTRLEWKNKLKGLIEGAKEKLTPSGERGEKMKKYLAGRTEALGEKAKKFGPGMEAFIRAKGEEYNKLSFLKKLLIGGALGVGAAAFSTVSTPLAAAFAINLGLQRAAGMAGMFLKTEKYLQDKKGRDIGFGSLSVREDRYKEAAATWAIGYTALMGTVIGEGVHLASESEYGQAVHEWLGRMLEHRSVSAPGISKDTSAPAPAAPSAASASAAEAAVQAQPAEAAASVPAEPAAQAQAESPAIAKPEASAAAPEIAQPASTNTATFEADAPAQPQASAQPAPEVTGTPQAPEASNVASVDIKATEGRGYEYMTKRLWEQLQEKNIKLPSGANPDSDLAKLLAADKDSIDAVVHQLAQENQFFKETGASVRINLDSHMSIDANGNIVLDGKNLAPGGPTTTPAMPGGIEKIDPASSLSRGESLIPDAANERPAGVAGGTATEVAVNPGSSGEDILIRTQEPAPLIDKDFVVNKFDIAIPLAEPHLYAGPTGENAVYAFGGDKKARLEAIYEYLSSHPTDTVIAADETEKYRAVWSMKDGKMTSSEPLRKTGFLGIFNALMEPPRPGELAKLIK